LKRQFWGEPIIAILHTYPGLPRNDAADAELDAQAKDNSISLTSSAVQRLADRLTYQSTFGIYPRPASRIIVGEDWNQKRFWAAIWGVVVPLMMLATGGFILLPVRFMGRATRRTA
jgi:hypothetical protein